MDKQFKVDNSILMFSMRYAMGRESYAPTIVIENIKHNLNYINNNILTLMIYEIEEYGRSSEDVHVNKWIKFQSLLEEILHVRRAFNIDAIEAAESTPAGSKYDYLVNVLGEQANNPMDIYNSRHDIKSVLASVGIDSDSKSVEECYDELVSVMNNRQQEIRSD